MGDHTRQAKKTKEYNDDSEVRNNILRSKRSELFEIFTNSLTSRAFKNIAKGRLDILATARPPRSTLKKY